MGGYPAGPRSQFVAVRWPLPLCPGGAGFILLTVSSRSSAWAGLLAGLVLNATFTVEGALRPGYHADTMFISELSLGPRCAVQKANFVVTGLLLLVAARGLRGVGQAPRYVALAGIGLLGAGVFDTDPFPRTTTTVPGLLHDGFAFLCFAAMIAAGFACAACWEARPAWWSWARPTRVAATAMGGLFTLVALGFRTPWKPAPDLLVNHIGTLQRLAQLGFFVWFVPLHVALLRRSRTEDPLAERGPR